MGKYAQVRAMDQTEPQREIIRSVQALHQAIEALQPQERLQEILDALGSRMEPLAQAMVNLIDELNRERERNKEAASEQREISKGLVRRLEGFGEKIEANLAKASAILEESRRVREGQLWNMVAAAAVGAATGGLMTVFLAWLK